MSKGLVIIGLIIVVCVFLYFAYPTINSFIQQSSYDKVTLPIGATIPYNEINQDYYEYGFRWGGLLGDQPTLLQVWAHPKTWDPKNISIEEGGVYTAYALEIKVSEIHDEYIVILVKHLA